MNNLCLCMHTSLYFAGLNFQSGPAWLHCHFSPLCSSYISQPCPGADLEGRDSDSEGLDFGNDGSVPMEMGASTKKSRSSTSNSSGGATAAVARKEIERKRRQQMKSLCVKLASLIPKEHYSSKDAMTQIDSLDEAAAYIKKLKERVDELQQRRSSAQLMAAGMVGGRGSAAASTSAATAMSGGGGSARSEEEAAGEEAVEAPVVEVLDCHDDGSSLDVVLISGVERPFKLHEVVTVLEEEGAEIINANLSVAGRRVFHTIHCRAFSPRIGIEVSRVSERLRALI